MAVDKTKNTQILITFPNDLLKQIEKYQDGKGIDHRSESVRELIRKGLEKEPSE